MFHLLKYDKSSVVTDKMGRPDISHDRPGGLGIVPEGFIDKEIS